METREAILNELKAIAPVTGAAQKREVYTVPDSYFDRLPALLLDRISTGFPENALKPSPLSVPAAYFSELPASILSQIKTADVYQELEATAPLLNTVSKQQVYTVPGDYFKNFGIRMTAELPKSAKIFSLSHTGKWISYAAAAIMAGVLMTGAFLYTDRPASFDLAKEVNKLSDEELVSYINSEHSVVFSPDSINLDPDLDVEGNLKLISDEELQQYLRDNQEAAQTVAHPKGS